MNQTAEGTAERPLVTFAVIAYNQEKYIREAVEGAFSQTYEPLEIILSDDCSTDRTFEIMQEMAAAYKGPHRVRVVQNPQNLGVVAHVMWRGKQASGDIVVLSAGDDISLSERTAFIVNAFDQDTGSVFSLVSIIDESGNTIAPLAERPLHSSRPKIYLRNENRKYHVIQGCSAAYKKWVFDLPVKSTNKNYAEDLLFSFYLNLIGAGIRRLDYPLVQYRAHPDALSNFRYRPVSPTQNERRGRRVAKEKLQMLDDFRDIALVLGKIDIMDRIAFEQARAAAQDIVDWPDLSFPQRLKRALTIDPRGNIQTSKWRFARLWGRYPNYQPKIFLSRFQKQYRLRANSRELP